MNATICKPVKCAAYCAIILALAGCASPTSHTEAVNELSNSKVSARAEQIANLKEAQAQEAKAVAIQNQVDADLAVGKAACIKVFAVNRCINKLVETHNAVWDSAQIDRTAARYYIRQYEANERRITLEQKMVAYNREQTAQAPIRAANQAAFQAKLKAYNERLSSPDPLTPEQRAANTLLFNQKRDKILEIKQKRIEADKARTKAKAAEDAAKAAAPATTIR